MNNFPDKFILVIVLIQISHLSSISQQNVIKGIVVQKDHYFRNLEGPEYINGAKVTYDSSFSITKDKGKFELIISEGEAGKNIDLGVSYRDWIVASTSKNSINGITIGKSEPLKIAICEKAYLDSEHQYIYNQHFSRIEAENEEKISELQGQIEKASNQINSILKRLELEGVENSDLKDSLQFHRRATQELRIRIDKIERKKENQLHNIEQILPELLAINLDDMDSTYQRAYRLFRSGESNKIYDSLYPEEKTVRDFENPPLSTKKSEKKIQNTLEGAFLAISALISEGKIQEAHKYYRNLHEKDTLNLRIIRKYGNFQIRQGYYQDGIKTLNRGLKAEKLNADHEEEILWRLLTAYAAIEDTNSAFNIYNKLVEKNKDNERIKASIETNMGFFLFKIGKYHDAEVHLKKGLELLEASKKDKDSDQSNIGDYEETERNLVMNLGVIYDEIGISKNQNSNSEAIELYEKANKYLSRAVHLEEKNRASIIAKGEKWTDQHKSSISHTYISMGRNLRNLEKFDSAKVYYLKAEHELKSIKEHFSIDIGRYDLLLAIIYNNIGEIYRLTDQYKEGLDYFQKSLEMYLEFAKYSPISYDQYVIGTAQNIYISTVGQENRDRKFYETYQVFEYMKRHALQNQNLSEIAATYFMCGRVIDEHVGNCDIATKLFEISVDCLEKDGLKNQGLWDSSILKLAKNQSCLRNYNEAELLYNKALDYYQDSLSLDIDKMDDVDILLFGSRKYVKKVIAVKEALVNLYFEKANFSAYEEKNYKKAFDAYKQLLATYNSTPYLYKESKDIRLRLAGEIDEMEAFIEIGEGDTGVLKYYFQIKEFTNKIDRSDTVATKIRMQLELSKSLNQLFEDLPENRRELIVPKLASSYGKLSWWYLLNKEFERGNNAAKKGLELDPSQKWIKANLAHSLLLTNQILAAKEIYLVIIQNSDEPNLLQAIKGDLQVLKNENIITYQLEKELMEVEALLRNKIKKLEGR